MGELNWADFTKIDMRVGAVVKAEVFKEARNLAYKLGIDFGDLRIKKTSSQITDLYTTQALINKQIIAVVNFPPKQIANFMS